MLILERRAGTSIRIGDDISVEVHEIRSRRAVKLAIRAPKEMPILREEIAHRFENRSGGTTPDHRDFRVTLVEDNPGHARLIRHALMDNGITHVTHHQRGQEAITRFGQQGVSQDRPSLILLDYSLPDMTGLEILNSLRTRDEYRATPVVMLSASNNDQHAAMCIDRGANAFVVKDTDYDDLKDSIGRITAFWKHAKLVA